MTKKAIIIGAGPAGLTAAYELQKHTDITPIIFEASNDIGGISKTVNYKGNRIDIGGHRFFSKSDRVMSWWNTLLPLQGAPTKEDLLLNISYQNKTQPVHLAAGGADPEKTDHVMLIRERLSRIFYLRTFFDYPVALNGQTIHNLGLWRMGRIGISYIKARIFPIKNEVSLQDFFINRFGWELYLTFFKDYTEKVWGVPCEQITAEWGAQRIKGLSITKALLHAFRSLWKKGGTSMSQKDIETSLIEQFMYPKFGPGQMWETVADQVLAAGGVIHKNHTVVGIVADPNHTITALKVHNHQTDEVETIEGDYFFSTMPIKDLIAGVEGIPIPENVRAVADGLMYRDFITVGLLLKKLKIKNETSKKTLHNIIPDNWIYIQERDVKVGRLQIFNNWSPYMVSDPKNVWIGLEYFVNEGDELWTMSDADFTAFAIAELAKIDIILPEDVLDSTLIRVKKTYPAYFGTYDRFDELRGWVDQFTNLFLIGRNGMHRYNNQDHSMLTAMTAVENIMRGITTKDNLWDVNVEKEYHEEKK